MTQFLKAIAALPLAAVASCQTPLLASSSSVFANPASYVGQRVMVCGRLGGTANIYEEPSGRGLSINSAGGGFGPLLVRLGEGARVCLTGNISYLGCQTDDRIICTDAAFDYVLHLKRVREVD